MEAIERLLKNVKQNQELVSEIIDLAVSDLNNWIPPQEIKKLRLLLREQLEQDPYLAQKIKRITGILGLPDRK